jgi:dipeptidase E
MKLLLISNSTNAGETYLSHCIEDINSFLGKKPVKALFIPYAAVTFSYDDYEKKVNEQFATIGHAVESIHRFSDPVEAVTNAQAIVIGGGNTWQLRRCMKDKKLLKVIKKAVKKGTPYIGWSAGSNVASPTIKTTNDMMVIDPHGLKALNLVPFQINPHYLDANPQGHAGETREDRIREYITINQECYVVGLREGTMLWVENDHLKLIGPKKARIFKYNTEPLELKVDDDFNFLMK